MIGACMFSRATRRRRHRNNLCNSDRARRRMRARRRELVTSEPRRYTSARITTPLYTSRGYRDAMTHGRTLARHTCITCVTCARHMSISIARRRESYEHRHSLRYNTHRRVVKCVRNQQSANRCARLSASSRIHRGRPRSAAVEYRSSRVDRDAHDVVPRERVDRVTSCRDLFQRHRAMARDTASCRRGLTHHARTTRVTFK